MKFSKVALGFLGLLAVLALLATGCSKTADDKKDADSGKVVGLAMHFMQDDYAVFLVKAFKETMDAAGIAYEITDGSADPQKQLNDISAMMVKKVDALVVIPFVETAIKDKCNEIAASGIPVISVTKMPGVDVVATISGGDYENGFGAGKALVDALGGKGKIAVFDAPFEVFRIQERIRGFYDAIKGTELEVVTVKKLVAKEDALAAMNEIITAYPDLNGVFGAFGNQIYGAGEALKARNIKNVAVTGIDADFGIMNLINEGYITGAAAQFPEAHGRLAAEAAIKAIRGETQVLDVEVPFMIVDKNNAKEMAEKLWGKVIG